MRYDKRYTRVLGLITAPEIPRLPDGGIALCHFCQRSVMFANGLPPLLERELRRAIMRFKKAKP